MDISKIKQLLNTQQPYIVILIGPPLSGKSSFIRNLKSAVNHEFVVISRDEILLDTYGSDHYEEAFKNVNQKEVDKKLLALMQNTAKEKKNAIVDMTHMTRKRRIHNLSYFKDYYKLGILFPILDKEEYKRRNLKRKGEEQKDISPMILANGY